jgi:hypothetical protein
MTELAARNKNRRAFHIKLEHDLAKDSLGVAFVALYQYPSDLDPRALSVLLLNDLNRADRGGAEAYAKGLSRSIRFWRISAARNIAKHTICGHAICCGMALQALASDGSLGEGDALDRLPRSVYCIP